MNDLCRNAKLIEDEIDKKMLELCKFSSGYSSNVATKRSNEELTNDREIISGIQKDIETCHSHLQSINEQMATSTLPSHVKQRHGEILQNFLLEYRRLRSSLQDKMERNKLFSHVDYSSKNTNGSSLLNRQNEVLMKLFSFFIH
ncbi:Golgi SNAP receptor complex member 1-like [Octopus sinensis]|uniref:Golgi SNAP receptor complex member 1 n=1 Tax=Octopus sinensis TaxID=2607531 RepID=A0A6P7TVM5_9MOLL|nr:Golgi SNAP receptor complex member 1-like [Octopus sinensis]